MIESVPTDPPQRSPRSRWFFCALVSVGMIVLTFGVIGTSEWWLHERDATVFATTVPTGEVATAADARWQVGMTDERADPAPPGTRIVRVEMDVSAGDADVSCGIPRLREIGGTAREWSPLASGDFLPDDASSAIVCPTAGTSVALALAYLVPDDAVGPFTLDVEVPPLSPGFLRFAL